MGRYNFFSVLFQGGVIGQNEKKLCPCRVPYISTLVHKFRGELNNIIAPLSENVNFPQEIFRNVQVCTD